MVERITEAGARRRAARTAARGAWREGRHRLDSLHMSRTHAAVAAALLASTLLAAFAARNASAQELRKAELRKIEVGKQIKEETKKAAVAAPTGPAKAAEMTEEQRTTKIAENERVASEKRRRAITLIDQMLAGNPRYAGRYDRLFQRAELEYEEAKYQYLVARKAYEDALDRGEKPVEPRPDYGPAIATWQQTRTENPQYDKIDEVRFHLALALESVERHVDALDVFAELVRDSAGSRYVPDAYLAMGEIWFELSKLGPARDNYREVVAKFGTSRLAGYARYKLGWTYVNDKNYQDAAKVLQEVVDAGGAYGRINLRDQALADLILVFAEMPDGIERARAYYGRALDKGRAREFLLRLAKYYDQQDKLEEALKLIALLQADAPTLPDLPNVHAFRVEILKRTGDLGRLDVELGQMAAFYDTGGEWDRANQTEALPRKAAQALLEESLEYLAIREHEEAQRLKDEARYKRAADAYANFLRRFPQSPRALRVRFFYAETLLKAASFLPAAAEYRQVVQAGATEFYEEAAYKTLFCFNEEMKRQSLDPEARIVAENEDLPKTPLSQLEVDFVAASDEFVQHVPKSPDTPSVLFKAAKTYYLHGELTLAADRFTKIIELSPKHKYAAFAGTLALDCYNRLRDWPGMVKWARYLIVSKNFEHKSREELRDIVARASANAVEALEKEGRHAEAADAMLAVVEEFPKSESADRNLFNAAALKEKSGDAKAAEKLYDRVRTDYPKGEYAVRATFILGAMAEARADFPKAAREYEAVAAGPKIDKTCDALFNAALLREALGSFDAAVGARRRYAGTCADANDAHEVFFAVGPLLWRTGKKKEALAHYDEYLKRYPGRSLLLTLDAHLRAGRLDRVLELFRAAKEPPGSPAATRAAEARFLQAEAIYGEFEAVSLNVPENKMRGAVDAKDKKVQAAIKAYVDVAQFRDPEWSAAALYKVGQCFQRFSESLMEAPIPQGLTEEEQEIYRAQLQEMGLPFEDNAVKNFERAVKLAHEQRIYNRWTALSAQHLAKYRPESFPTLDRPAVEPVHVAE